MRWDAGPETNGEEEEEEGEGAASMIARLSFSGIGTKWVMKSRERQRREIGVGFVSIISLPSQI